MAPDPGLRFRVLRRFTVALTVTSVASGAAAQATVTLSHSGKRLSSFAPALANPLTGKCGRTPLQLQLGVSRSGRASGRLTTGGRTAGGEP